MADWTVIPATVFEQDKPVLASTHLAISANITAAFEGATGGPKLADAALDTTVTNAGRDWAMNRIAAGNAGAVGAYVLATDESDAGGGWNSSIAGSNLDPASVGTNTAGSNRSGTWLCVGHTTTAGGASAEKSTTLWKRTA